MSVYALEAIALRRAQSLTTIVQTELQRLIAALRAGDVDTARRLGEEHALAGRRRWEATLGAGTIAEEPIRTSAPPKPESEEARSKKQIKEGLKAHRTRTVVCNG